MFHRPPRPEDNVHNIICGKCIKVLLKIKLLGLAHRNSLVSLRQSFSPPLTLSFRLVPIWNTEVSRVYLFAWVSKTWTGRRSASSLPRETRRAPVAYVNGACPLSWGCIGFLHKPRNISLSRLYFLNCNIISLSLSISLNKFLSPSISLNK